MQQKDTKNKYKRNVERKTYNRNIAIVNHDRKNEQEKQREKK